jgi:hypothetical protein
VMSFCACILKILSIWDAGSKMQVGALTALWGCAAVWF